jgi:hypothetical protein
VGTGNFVLGAAMLVLGLLFWIFPREKTSFSQRLAPVLPFLISFVSFATGVSTILSSRNDPGAIKQARLIVTPSGLKIAALDELSHFDLTVLLAKRGDVKWTEQRLLVFDVATKTRIFRHSLVGVGLDLPVELLGDFGGKIGVRTTRGYHPELRLLAVEDGKELGGANVLIPAILAKNPDFKTVRSTVMNNSQCLEAVTADYRMTIDPHDLVVNASGHCNGASIYGGERLEFDKHASVSLSRVEEKLPAGAAPLHNIDASHLRFSSRVDMGRAFQNAIFAVDTRNGDPLFFGEPRRGLLLYTEGGQLMAAAVSPKEVVWQVRLPNKLTELTVVNGSLVAVSLSSVEIIDPANGNISAAFDLK